MFRSKKTGLAKLSTLLFVLICALVGSSVIIMPPESEQSIVLPSPATIEVDPISSTIPEPVLKSESAVTPYTEPESRLEPEPEGEAGPEYFTIAMMGDCILGSERTVKGLSYAIEAIVGDDYTYPFSMVRNLYEDADFAIVNLECAITDYNIRQERMFNFRAPPSYVNILLEGGIDFAALGNNHYFDYGQKGYEDTQEILSTNGIGFAKDGGWDLFITDSGLRIGVYSQYLPVVPDVEKAVSEMKDAGAELIIAAIHWGEEGTYRPSASQKQLGRAAIDAGAHIVMGTHPHTLQPFEEYNGGVIYYSLANWVMGGNSNPVDKDTVLAKVTVMRDIDGNISLTGIENIPCSVSGDMSKNDYRPVPYKAETKEYERALSKITGSFTGRDIGVSYREAKSETTDEQVINP